MSIKKRIKKNLGTGRMADGGRGVWMRCVRTSMKVKKRKRKETYLRFGGVDGDALCVDGLAYGWSCVRMVLRADGLACGWSCMQTALHAGADGGGYRGGGRG